MDAETEIVLRWLNAEDPRIVFIEDRDYYKTLAENDAKALRALLDELGVPGDDYPAPVANAVDIAQAALSAHPADQPAQEKHG